MTWLYHHQLSEQLASDAEVANRLGEQAKAESLYFDAAKAEEQALEHIKPNKSRTYGITTVSAVSLYFKAAQWANARSLAYRCLGSGQLPDFATHQLDDLLAWIKAEQSGIDIAGGHMLVSMLGGEILSGGAPIDLVITKIQKLKSLLYRTAEHIKDLPHRKRGEPSKEIQESYKPWIFQAMPGSYQFQIAVQTDRQLNMFSQNDPDPRQIVDRLYRILQACAESPQHDLLGEVPAADYRGTFLKLARDLAPTGKGFSRLSIRSPDSKRSLVMLPATRDAINDVIRGTGSTTVMGQERDIRGVLRALHLDADWIEVNEEGKNVRIERVNEDVDDRIGPMVNHPVIVHVAEANGKLRYRDIESDD